MICVAEATEDDMPRLLEIEREAISPPWTEGALLSEIYREDSFFAVAVCQETGRCSASSVAQDNSPPARLRSRCTLPAGTSPSGISPSGTSPSGTLPPDARPPAVTLGFVILRRAGDEGELFQIAVDNAARRQGAADILMGAALDYASEKSLSSVFLEVRKSNEAAIGLYKKHGFEPVRRRKDYYSDPVEDAVIMVKNY